MSPARNPQADSRFNLNSVLILLSIGGCIVTAVFFIAPLRTMPNDVKAMQGAMIDVQRTQAIQTEALKTLADVTKDGRDLRRDFDRESAKTEAAIRRHDFELEAVRKKLDKLDSP